MHFNTFSHLNDRSFRKLISEERLTSAEDRWSESPSSKRHPTPSRNYDEFQKNSIVPGRRYSYDDRSVSKTDSRSDRVQNGTYRDHRRRSTDDDSSDKKVNTPRRTRVTSSSDDHFERIENNLKRASSLRRDITLDNLERSPAHHISRRSSFESDVQTRKSPSRDVTSPRRAARERARLLETQSPQGRSIKGNRRDEVETRSIRREEQSHDVSRNRERESPQERNTPDDADRISAKRSSGRSSLESDIQSPRKTASKEIIIKHKNSEDVPKTINDPQVTDPQRTIEKNQEIKDSARIVDIQQNKQNNVGAKRQETRRLQSREDPKITKVQAAEDTSSKKIASNDMVSSMEIPKEEWACEHCTFINKVKDRVCVVCCKTKSSALPPSTLNDDPEAGSIEEAQATKHESSSVSNPSPDLEKRTNLLKISNSEESGDSGSVKNKGRPKRKISFSFGTKLSK